METTLPAGLTLVLVCLVDQITRSRISWLPCAQSSLGCGSEVGYDTFGCMLESGGPPLQGQGVKQETACRQSPDKQTVRACVCVCVRQFDWHLLVSQSSFKRRLCASCSFSFLFRNALCVLRTFTFSPGPLHGSRRSFSPRARGCSRSVSWNAVDFLNPHQSILGLRGRAYLKPPFFFHVSYVWNL